MSLKSLKLTLTKVTGSFTFQKLTFGTVSYSHSIVGLTTALSCIISEIKQNGDYFIAPAFDATAGVPVSIVP